MNIETTGVNLREVLRAMRPASWMCTDGAHRCQGRMSPRAECSSLTIQGMPWKKLTGADSRAIEKISLSKRSIPVLNTTSRSLSDARWRSGPRGFRERAFEMAVSR